ncbi:spore coat protein CotJB [Alteribacillus sp. HJP-4]|uniref:spore coat protein CotJB n=1 Tax=Alteribacillus sp. HJP-4 TaxID=2775394 RepID=UPI0035CD18D1
MKDQQTQLPEEFYRLMEELQAIDFVLVELTLYLDTHPDDYEAIQQFNETAQYRQHLKFSVEEYYGPLLQYGQCLSYSSYPWNWNKAPWPWQL